MGLRVNGIFIPDSALRQERAAIRRDFAEMIGQLSFAGAQQALSDSARRQIVARLVLREAAWRNPEPLPPDWIEQELGTARKTSAAASPCGTSLEREAEENLRVRLLLYRIRQQVPPPNRKEVELYYKTHRSQFFAPEQIHARQIVKNVHHPSDRAACEQQMDEIRNKLEQGASFEALADAYSDCPGQGGDMGWFTPGSMVDEFDAVVLALAPGATSPVFETRFGFHIVRLLERLPAGIQTLSQVRDELTQRLHRERQSRAVQKYVSGLIERASVEVVPG